MKSRILAGASEGKKFAMKPWWIQIEELVDDPILMDFIKALEKKFDEKYE